MCTDGACGRVTTMKDDDLCMGWGEAAYAAATMAAGAYSANAASNTASSVSQNNIEANMVSQAANMGYNSHEAALARDAGAVEAGKQRQFAHQMTLDSQAFNSAQAATDREFQERMSNTQYQRAIGDMKQAGLNPMLAYSQGGAGTPKGSTASASPASGAAASQGSASFSGGNPSSPVTMAPNPLSEVGSAVKALSFKNEQDNLKAQTGLMEANADVARTNVPKNIQETRNLEEQVSEIKQRIAESKYRIENIAQDTNNKYNQEELITAQRDLARAAEKLTHAETSYKVGQTSMQQFQRAVLSAEAMIRNAQVPGEVNQGEANKGFYGEKIRPYLQDVGSIVRSGAGVAGAMR